MGKKLKPNELTQEKKVSMKTRILTALIGLTLVSPLLIFGDWPAFIFLMATAFVAFFEIIRCAKSKYHHILIYIVGIAIGLLIVAWPILNRLLSSIWSKEVLDIHVYSYYGKPYMPIMIIFLGIFLLFVMVVLHTDFTVKDACFLFTMILFIGLAVQSLLYLRYIPSYINMFDETGTQIVTTGLNINWFDNFKSSILFVFVLVSSWITDAFAYFVGIFFGKTKINERISPSKTYAGFYGGIVAAILFTFSAGIILALLDVPLLEGVIDKYHWWNILILSIIIPIISSLGDFIFSSVKRFYDIKDFGKLLPGHGGILDRFDSIFFASVASSIFVCVAIVCCKGIDPSILLL